MENPKLALELTTYVQYFVHSSKLFYQTYSLKVRLLGLVLLAWASFKVGKKTVVDLLEEEVKQMKIIMATRHQYTIVIPKKIKYLGTRSTILFVLLILTAIAYFAGKHFKPEIMENVDVVFLILGGGLIMVIILLNWFYQLYLRFKLRRGNYKDQQIINKISNFVKMLGWKARRLKRCSNIFCARRYTICTKQNRLVSAESRSASSIEVCWSRNSREWPIWLTISSTSSGVWPATRDNLLINTWIPIQQLQRGG